MKKIILLILFASTVGAVFAQTNAVKDVSSIQSARKAINDAIVSHDADKMSQYWLNDLVLVRGNSTHLTGRDSITAEWKQLFSDKPGISYVRTPVQITISTNDTLAWETGTWKAFNSYRKGGNYSAMWKKTNNSWKILAELFVSLF